MGCSASTPLDPTTKEATKEAFKQNAFIDKMIRMDKKRYNRTVKILLLGISMHTFSASGRIQRIDMLNFWSGAGESGKSTIIKQMRIIHSGGFPEEERRQNRAVIYSNLVVAFKILLDIMEAENIEYEDEKTKVRTWNRDWCAPSSLI
jgi:hypothetical protein